MISLLIQPVKLTIYEMDATSEGYVLVILSYDRAIPRLQWIFETIVYTISHVCFDFFLFIKVYGWIYFMYQA